MGLLDKSARALEAKSDTRMRQAELDQRDLLRQLLAVETEQRDLLRRLVHALHEEAVKKQS